MSFTAFQRLLPSQFGIPNKRKYPIHDDEHVRLAIKMFNSCDADEEKELAENIIKQIDKFGMTDIKVSAANRFRKFYEKFCLAHVRALFEFPCRRMLSI